MTEPFSTHKDRTVWFSQRACWPLRDVSPAALEVVWKQRLKAKGQYSPPWQCAGPVNISGRITSLVAVPGHHSLLLAGSAAGGVWKSNDGGRSWKTTWPKSVSANIGALAISPNDSKTIFCATGEANLSGDSYAGDGIHVSRNGGETWEQLASAGEAGLPRRIGVLAICPWKPSWIFLGGVTHDEGMPAGMYRSTDCGKTWVVQKNISASNYWCNSIVFHPDGLIFVGVTMRGAGSGIWRASAEEYQHLSRGLPSFETMGRISLALAPSRPNTIYAVVADWRGKKLAGIFRSRDKGERWTEIGSRQFSRENQMSYANAIAVHPEDPDFVVWGGTDLYLTRNGGKKWVRATRGNLDEDKPQYTHSDHHAIIMPGGPFIYTATDGGVFASENEGRSWVARSNQMVTTMFYSADVAPSNSKFFGGGTQDNGTLVALEGSADGEFQRALFGDGGWMVFDPADCEHAFGSSQNIAIMRHPPSKKWDDRRWKKAAPKSLTDGERNQTALAVMTIEPTRAGGKKTIYMGSRRLWRTMNSAGTWRAISPSFDGSVVSAIDVAAADRDQVLVGTTKGKIFKTKNARAEQVDWSGDLSGPNIPMRLISQIRTHPKSADQIVVTIAGTGMVSRLIHHRKKGIVMNHQRTGIKHVYYSEDGGLTWRALDGRNMPDVSYSCAVWESREPYRLFVGTDCGVWGTKDLKRWMDLSDTLPNVMISGLVYHHDDEVLMAATYGRGIWRLNLKEVHW